MSPPMFWIPNGAYLLEMFGSRKSPVVFTRLNSPSNTSTRRLWKSAAYRKSPCEVEAMARPLYSAPTRRRFTTVKAFVDGGGGGTPGFQPRIRPLAVAN